MRRRQARRATLAVAMALAALPAHAGARKPHGAVAFVNGIYARWQAELARGNRGYQPPADARLYAPELAALLAQERALARAEGGVALIDHVILCACQDDEGLQATARLLGGDAARARVAVSLRFGQTPGAVLELRLVRLAAGWRIADVIAPDPAGGSLAAWLRAGLARWP